MSTLHSTHRVMLSVSSEVRGRLQLFRRQYLQLLELRHLKYPAEEHLRRAEVQAWLYSKLFHVEENPRLPPERYRMQVLKTLLAKVEASIKDPEEDEISNDLMNSLVMLMDSPLPTQADAVLQKSWVTYMPVTAWCSSSSEDSCLTIQENHAVISGAGTTGLRTWEAALHLGSYLLSSEEAASLVSGKAVLELGAGTGFLSVLCAQNLDAKHVIATDGDLGVIEALRENIQFNEVADKVSAGTFRWADALKGTLVGGETKGQPLDTVLGADVTYDKAMIPALICTIRDMFEEWPLVVVIISATIRNLDTFEAFENACGEDGFTTTNIDHPLLPMSEQTSLFHSADVPIRLMKITAPADRKSLFVA